eukprot:EG_transcript_35894
MRRSTSCEALAAARSALRRTANCGKDWGLVLAVTLLYLFEAMFTVSETSLQGSGAAVLTSGRSSAIYDDRDPEPNYPLENSSFHFPSSGVLNGAAGGRGVWFFFHWPGLQF